MSVTVYIRVYMYIYIYTRMYTYVYVYIKEYVYICVFKFISHRHDNTWIQTTAANDVAKPAPPLRNLNTTSRTTKGRSRRCAARGQLTTTNFEMDFGRF